MFQLNANEIIGSHHVLFMTFDSLRYDVARATMHAGRTPALERVLPDGLWEERRTQGTFTYPAHQAFFAGFLPVPSGPNRPPRLLACQAVPGKGRTIATTTYVFSDAPDIVQGFAGIGYRTVCIGGVGYFNNITRLGRVLPGLFQEAYWTQDTSPDCYDSTRHQVDRALAVLDEQVPDQRLFLFINIAATHEPTAGYIPGETRDSWESQCAALSYADGELSRLFEQLPQHGPWLAILCADHGDAFGEDGHSGHGIAHPCVSSVPYAHTLIPSV
ncbi:STM4013/SEN3800 family hydrolase [Kitasatospora sp. NPDC058478]|uniref:STM4013/SEN3800 family hydrolase n=1 Tax=unclassified Kitasatospora TaxID=2633591 RepID=UPI00364AFB04